MDEMSVKETELTRVSSNVLTLRSELETKTESFTHLKKSLQDYARSMILIPGFLQLMKSKPGTVNK